MNDLLEVPGFMRLTDYVGAWCVEPDRFRSMWYLTRDMDFTAHFAEASTELRAVTEMVGGPSGKSIAVVKATGLLMKGQSSLGGTSTVQLRREIRQAANDPNVAGILLAIDSPGGTVAGTDDLARDVKAAGRQKPVWAQIEDLGASAAYWLASQTQRIVANSPTALVGSIGTLQVVTDYSAAAEKAGIRTLVFSTGPLKGIGTPGTKITDEQAAHLQKIVETVQQSFDAAVQKGRGLTNKELGAVRHGGVFTAGEALDAKLIDAVQPLSKTINDFATAIKAGPSDPRAIVSEEAAEAHGAFSALRRHVPVLKVG